MDTTEKDIENPTPELPNTIRIKALGFENIVPTYPVADVTMKFELADVVLAESEKTHVSNYKFVPTDYEIAIPCDLTAQSDLNKFISFPITITVIETAKEVSMSKIELPRIQSKEKSQSDFSKTSLSSARSKSNSRVDKKSKDKKGKPKDRKEPKLRRGASSISQNEAPTGPLVIGVAMLDLLPIFLGATEFSQELCVRQVTKELGEKAIAVADLPKLRVTINLEGPGIDVEKSCIMHISVESIFNIPNLLAPNYCYQLSIILPINSDDFESIDFNEGTHTANGDFIRYKFWPAPNGKPHLESTYRIDNDLSAIVNRHNVNLGMNNIAKCRIEYNVLQRVFLTNESRERIFKHIRNFRKIPVEIYVTPTKPDPSQPGSAPEKKKAGKAVGKKDKGDKTKNSTITTKSKNDSTCLLGDPSEFLHLMAIVNVDHLLYPGVKTCRIACPISTYHEQEILKLTGVTNSHFRPKSPHVSEEKLVKEKKGDKKKEKGNKKGSKGSKSSKDSKKSKESKDSKKSGKTKKGKGKETESKTGGLNLAEKLPPGPPPEPEPSIQVFNDQGEPSFLIIEFTFSKPLHAERQLEDLSNKLSTIVRGIPALPKYLISSSVAQEMFNETVRALTKDINYQYLQFIEEQTLCKCEHIPDFLTYLQQSGAYQTYLASITRALATLIPEKYQFQNDSQGKCSKEYQCFIKYVHTDMVRQTNKVINEFVICNLNKIPHKHLVKNEELLLYAKEATEMGEYDLAERYYLERICCDENNANFWFDYAIYHMEMKSYDNVIQCLKEVLSLDSSHQYSLLMYGLILYEKGKAAEAETCLLTLTLMHPRWPEGWGGLFTYYHSVQNIEGMELALQMANKYIDGPGATTDYFNAVDDLAWSTQFCLDNIYSKTAVLLIKMRLTEPAETLINLVPQQGVREYLMAVLAYYNRNYFHSLQHLENAKDALGLDYGICSLIGHCFLKINNHSNALIFYEMVLPMYNRPDDMHLTFLFSAICYDTIGSWQKARKVALLACKYSPTPQTWMHAGSYYFKQNDLLSAEQCLVQANLCDNRLAEPWIYLALVNVHLGKKYETELCLSQAKKFGEKDLPLIANVEKIIESMDT